MSDFSHRLIRWHKRHGRHDLPWQNTTDPYRVWLSEIMLQQTQVATATPYYARFLEHFPTLADLANAPVGEVMALWSGLGYYARARNLHACARVLMEQHGGQFPHQPERLAALPGIGRSTANSIATFCFGARAPILDGNVKRVLTRCFGIDGFPGNALVGKQLWLLAEQLMPAKHGDIYNQAQMDLGATLCVRSKPRCDDCPLADICEANATGKQAELPHKKTRATIPEREVTLLILRHDNHILLEQRPPAGIWGGMLSLPELPDGISPENFASDCHGCRIHAGEAGNSQSTALRLRSGSAVQSRHCTSLPTVVHAFSHFRLYIQPLLCDVTPSATAMETGALWISLDELEQAALPAPIKKLLCTLV